MAKGSARQYSRAQKISGNHRAYVAGQPEDLTRIPEIEREGGFDKRKVVSFKELFDGANPGRRDGEEILGVGGNQIQGIQFASVGGATYRLIKDKGSGGNFRRIGCCRTFVIEAGEDYSGDFGF